MTTTLVVIISLLVVLLLGFIGGIIEISSTCKKMQKEYESEIVDVRSKEIAKRWEKESHYRHIVKELNKLFKRERLIPIRILNIEYDCRHNVEFPEYITVRKLDREMIMIELENLAQIDFNDHAVVEVYDVEWEEIK